MSALTKRLILGFGIAALVIVADQVSKYWVVTVLMQPPRLVELTGWLNLVMTWNHGISFGLFSGDAMPYVLAGVAVAVVVLLVVWLIRADGVLAGLALGLVIGGAVGNVIDRIRVGAVADFIDFHIGAWHFPWAFNIADSAISVGVALIVIDGLFSHPEMS